MIIRLVILFLVVTTVFPARAADLKVLSWNTFMLPWPIKNSNQKIRTDVIAYSLQNEDYDFIFMQEAFIDSFRDKVGKTLKKEYPHQYYLKNNGFIYPFFGSGVFILGKHPFKVVDKVYYKKCGASDCWASKGAAMIESTLPSGKTIQVAVTHLQAKENLGEVRLSQLEQVKGMLKKNKKRGIPQLFIGDLNIDAKEKEFHEGLDLMGMNFTQLTGSIDHTNVIDCYKKPDHEKEWIDHMWVDRGTHVKDSTISAKVVDYEHKGKICMASDHYPIEGSFTFAD